MPKVVGIKFKKSPKMYYFAAGDFEYQAGMGVVVETARGLEMGTVQMLPEDVSDDKIIPPLKPIVRLATDKDNETVKRQEDMRAETMRITEEKINKSKLNMKLVDVEHTFDGTKLIIYFTADGRVDFRELVKDLAGAFHLRIELRQIGARDECRMMGGIAPCGRACCCSDALSDFAHVSIKMAKNQNLSLNPSKISGLCGRLMCCLSYENAHYVETNKRMPKIGAEVSFNGKTGVAIGLNQLKELVKVKVAEKDSFEYFDVPLAELNFKAKERAIDDVDKDDKLDDDIKNLLD